MLLLFLEPLLAQCVGYALQFFADLTRHAQIFNSLSLQEIIFCATFFFFFPQDLRVASAATSSSQFGTTFGIAIGSVAVFIMLVVAVVMLRRRSSPRTSVTHGYVEVDPAASPEERHVANMQMNGYENPTYRYFEVHSQQ